MPLYSARSQVAAVADDTWFEQLPDWTRESAVTLAGLLGLEGALVPWLALANVTRDEASGYLRAESLSGAHEILGTCGGLTLRLLGFHVAWARQPGGSAKEYQGVSRLLAEPIHNALADRLITTSVPATESGPAQNRIRQLVGAVAVVGAYERLYEEVRDLAPPLELAAPKAALFEMAAQQGMRPPQFQHLGSEGPPHAAVHKVSVTCNGRTSGSAQGATKKAAEDAAATHWLKIHAAKWLQQRLVAQAPAPRAPLVVDPGHAARIYELAAILKLARDDAGLLSAALTFRQAPETSAAQRTAASGLAQLGADVLQTAAYAGLAVAAAAGDVAMNATLVVNTHLAADSLAARMAQSRLEPAYIPSTEDVPAQHLADALQAAAALVHLSRVDPVDAVRSLRAVDIDMGAGLLQVVGGDPRALQHPKMALQEVGVILGVSPEYRLADTRGPPHNAEHRVAVTLRKANGKAASALSPWSSSRREAERRVAAIILRVLELHDTVLHNAKARHVAAFLLTGPALNLPGSLTARTWPTLRQLPLFRYLSLGAWTDAVEWLARCEAIAGGEERASWERLFAAAVDSRDVLTDSELSASLLDLVSGVAALDPTDPITGQLDALDVKLLTLLDVLRVRSRPRELRRLHDIVDEIEVLHGRRRNISASGDLGTEIIERTGTVLTLVAATLRRDGAAACDWVLEARRRNSRVVVEFSSSVEIGDPEPDFFDLLTRDAPLIDIRTHARGVTATWIANPSPAMQRLFPRGGGHTTDERAAGLLHDLKNALAAFRSASARATASVTDRLRVQYEASRHLDTARSACQALLQLAGRATSGQPEVVDLGAFLSGYLTELVSRRPVGVSVEVPAYPSVDAAVQLPLLRSAIDNLVKNALEAMPDGGRVSISLGAGANARITVHDTGRGMSDLQQQALREGRVVDSTKREGSGLGLAAVASAARRLRARLDVQSKPGATAVTLHLPVDEDSLG